VMLSCSPASSMRVWDGGSTWPPVPMRLVS